jgi:hypothetical protein
MQLARKNRRFKRHYLKPNVFSLIGLICLIMQGRLSLVVGSDSSSIVIEVIKAIDWVELAEMINQMQVKMISERYSED